MKGIPSPSGLDPATQRVLEPIIEIIEEREGMRRKSRSMNVTFEDLIELGLITESQADDYIA